MMLAWDRLQRPLKRNFSRDRKPTAVRSDGPWVKTVTNVNSSVFRPAVRSARLLGSYMTARHKRWFIPRAVNVGRLQSSRMMWAIPKIVPPRSSVEGVSWTPS
jgi:hypothetical protein